MALVNTINAAGVEAAIRDFLANDITVEAFGAATSCRRLLGEAPLARTVHVALSGRARTRTRRPTRWRRVVPWGSFVLLQGLVGTAFTRQGRYEDALRVHLAALRLTPNGIRPRSIACSTLSPMTSCTSAASRRPRASPSARSSGTRPTRRRS